MCMPKQVSEDLDVRAQGPTSLSSCLARRVICLRTSRGASSESLIMNVDTDFGPLVSLLLNSLLLRSLDDD